MTKSLINKLCDKYLSFDKYLSPSKKLLIATDKEMEEGETKPVYTECEILDHAIMFWPNQDSFGKNLDTLYKNRCEIIGLGFDKCDSGLF